MFVSDVCFIFQVDRKYSASWYFQLKDFDPKCYLVIITHRPIVSFVTSPKVLQVFSVLIKAAYLASDHQFNFERPFLASFHNNLSFRLWHPLPFLSRVPPSLAQLNLVNLIKSGISSKFLSSWLDLLPKRPFSRVKYLFIRRSTNLLRPFWRKSRPSLPYINAGLY